MPERCQTTAGEIENSGAKAGWRIKALVGFL